MRSNAVVQMSDLTDMQLTLAADELAGFPDDYPVGIPEKVKGVVSAIRTSGHSLSSQARLDVLEVMTTCENLAFQMGRGPDDPPTLMLWRALWRCGRLLHERGDARRWVAPDMVLLEMPIPGSEDLIPSKFRALVSGLASVCLFDRNHVTYCCSTQPSYWVMSLYARFVLRDPSTKLAEDIELELDQLSSDWEMQSQSELGGYSDVHYVDGLVDKYRRAPNQYPFSLKELGSNDADWVELMEDDPTDAEYAYDTMIDAAREYFNSNHRL